MRRRATLLSVRAHVGRLPRLVAAYVGCAAVAALLAVPLALEVAVEQARFEDDLGTLPVEVRLQHNGRSTLDTGILGKVFWTQTGPLGFGVQARVNGPPQAGGTLASYVDGDFIRANAALIEDPGVVVDAYATKFADALRSRFLATELLAALLGGGVLLALVPWGRLGGVPMSRVATTTLVAALVGASLSAGAAALRFGGWSGNRPVAGDHQMPGVERLSFSSAQALEVAKQVEPFLTKNTERIREESQRYEAATRSGVAVALANRAEELTPREGETVVIAEADPQGSRVGARVRAALHEQLRATFGRDAFAVRTISGDVTSNGTVAESSYVTLEAEVSGEVPTVAVGGDHDSEVTWEQMQESGMQLLDLETTEVGGVRISGAHDPEHKTLFGGSVTNSSGVSEPELGRRLREAVTDEPQVVLLHQPEAAAAYLGLTSLEPVRGLTGSATLAAEDGIDDQVPGLLLIGHLHELDGPWVIWNTAGDVLTWTLVDQLGTAGGVENHPTFNRFSTPGSAPLKPLSLRLHYLDATSGLSTGYATVSCTPDGSCSVSRRTDVGLPGGQPLVIAGDDGSPDELTGAGRAARRASEDPARAGRR